MWLSGSFVLRGLRSKLYFIFIFIFSRLTF
jgi:hypothetical protein